MLADDMHNVVVCGFEENATRGVFVYITPSNSSGSMQ
jgi:hypothetical protein